VADYSGDGVFHPLGSHQFDVGYLIDFGEMIIGDTVEKSFIINKLPDLKKEHFFKIQFMRSEEEMKMLSDKINITYKILYIDSILYSFIFRLDTLQLSRNDALGYFPNTCSIVFMPQLYKKLGSTFNIDFPNSSSIPIPLEIRIQFHPTQYGEVKDIKCHALIRAGGTI